MVVFLVFRIKSNSELLYRRDDNLVGIVGGLKSPNKCFCISVFFYATLLKLIKLISSLAV